MDSVRKIFWENWNFWRYWKKFFETSSNCSCKRGLFEATFVHEIQQHETMIFFFFLISPITPNLSSQAPCIHVLANLFLHKLEWKCLNYVQFQWALQNFYSSTVFLFKKKFTISRNILFTLNNDLSSIKAIEDYSIFYFPAIFLRKYSWYSRIERERVDIFFSMIQ